MFTTPPIPQSPKPSGLASYRALIDRLTSMDDAEFGGVNPGSLIPISVLVLVKSRVVSQIQGS
jgi:hypothetical protein